MSQSLVFTTSKNNPLRITTFGIENLKASPAIFLVHGFKGFKDWGFGPYIGKFLSKKFFVVTFNFSHNGVGESLTEFDELDKFAANTFSLEVSELSELADAYLSGFFGKTDNRKIGFLGHSRGGGISILTARFKNEVKAAALWSSVASFDRYSLRQKEKWKREGVFEVLNQRTKQVMKLNVSLLNDLEENKDDKLNILKAAEEFNRPLLIAHGEQDLAVKPSDAKLIYESSNKELSELYLIPGAGHTFDVKHPFEGSNPKLEKLLNKTEQFFIENLYEEKNDS